MRPHRLSFGLEVILAHPDADRVLLERLGELRCSRMDVSTRQWPLLVAALVLVVVELALGLRVVAVAEIACRRGDRLL